MYFLDQSWCHFCDFRYAIQWMNVNFSSSLHMKVTFYTYLFDTTARKCISMILRVRQCITICLVASDVVLPLLLLNETKTLHILNSWRFGFIIHYASTKINIELLAFASFKDTYWHLCEVECCLVIKTFYPGFHFDWFLVGNGVDTYQKKKKEFASGYTDSFTSKIREHLAFWALFIHYFEVFLFCHKVMRGWVCVAS